MASRNVESATRLVAVVLLTFVPVMVGCGKKEEQAAPGPTVTRAASPVALTPQGSPEARPSALPVATATPPTPAERAASPATPTPSGPAATTAPASPPPPSTEAQSTTPAPSPTLSTRPQPEGKITLPAKLGAVTFDHGKHAEGVAAACTSCHHASRPQKPLLAEQQACRDCHTMPPTPPMQTSLQAAFHDPKATAGLCVDCHRQAVANRKKPPVKCLECHRQATR